QKQKSGLRLDTAAALKEGGDSGSAIAEGKPAESLLIQAITGTEGVAEMPPKEPRLTADQIAILKAWVAAGAKSPADEDPAAPAEIQKSTHWAFQPLNRPELPKVQRGEWVHTPIDAFILARLEQAGLAPSPEADRATLIRRLSLDLLGLLPSPAEVDAFVADESPDAYERLVDRLLESPHYGERWGRHWLDVARYADSNGFTRDMPRSIWKYRDWVIDALNRDLPFDEFTIEQMAGDLLPNATTEQKIATGFHRNTLINEEGGTDPEQFRIESVVDRVNTTGAAFLGLTVGCAQCHDHKYDPISQREYYQFFAFLNNADEPKLEVPTPEQLADHAFEKRAELRRQIAELDKDFKARAEEFAQDMLDWEKSLTEEQKKELPFEVLNVVNLAARDRNDDHKKLLTEYYKKLDAPRQKYPALEQIAVLRKQEPQFVSTMVLQERQQPRETFVHLRGDFLRHGAKVEPAVPRVLPPLVANEGPANRLALARWLVSGENPLTPRVVMNRFWQKYFGRGLVETENDFGTQGTAPTHPELLDWLASEFIARKWSMKAMHRLLVTSAVYRQSSRSRVDAAEMDPENKLLARQMRLRLDAEIIRDAALSASDR
ncbi:MAG TPA: PSD1 and planctomycete cytochrome C domain-containing protein, partial [Planctomycetaceae bacterium]|nr:PSD1 and planctomycete cytochrome C domain-containing protein [Planctomycetaceae bacterium]